MRLDHASKPCKSMRWAAIQRVLMLRQQNSRKTKLRSDRNFARLISTFATVIVAGVVSGCSTAPPAPQTGADAEITFDGLHKWDNTRVDAAWAVPDLDLSGYWKILPVNVGIEYREVKNRGNTTAARSKGGPYFIDDKARAQFEALVDEIVTEELQKSSRFEIVDEPGPGTLIVSGGLLNVTSQVPPDSIGRSRIYLSSVGDATLVLEFRDSETNRILGRAVDRRAAETVGGTFTISNTVTTNAEVRRLIRYWGTLVREGLEGFTRNP